MHGSKTCWTPLSTPVPLTYLGLFPHFYFLCLKDLQNGENRDSRNLMGLEMSEGFGQVLPVWQRITFAHCSVQGMEGPLERNVVVLFAIGWTLCRENFDALLLFFRLKYYLKNQACKYILRHLFFLWPGCFFFFLTNIVMIPTSSHIILCLSKSQCALSSHCIFVVRGSLLNSPLCTCMFVWTEESQPHNIGNVNQVSLL